jgi:hypothetical protein
MKLYGSNRHDKLTCVYGCCGFKLNPRYKGSLCEVRARRSARKRARRDAKKECAV